MPQALAVPIIGSITVGTIVKAAAFGFASVMLAKSAVGKIGRVQNKLDTAARYGTVVAVESPARYIFGEYRVGLIKTFEDTLEFQPAADDGTRSAGVDHHQVGVIGDSPLDSITEFYIDGEKVLMEKNPSGVWEPPAGHKWKGFLWVYESLDGLGNDGAEIRKAFPVIAEDDSSYDPDKPQWTTDHKGLGLAYLHVVSRQPPYRSDDPIETRRKFTSWPIVETVVRGLKITWPGQTTPAWTENCASVRYWWHTVRRGEPVELQDLTTVPAAIARCAETETVVLPPQYEGYSDTYQFASFNGVILGTETPEDIEAEIDWQWAGDAPIGTNGLRQYLPGALRPATLEILEDDIQRRGRFRAWLPIEDRINAARMSLAQSRAHDYTELDIPELVDDPAFARDGQKLSVDLGTRRFETNPVAAVSKLALQLRRARSSALYDDLVLKPGDFRYINAPIGSIANINDSEIGLSSEAQGSTPAPRFRMVSRLLLTDDDNAFACSVSLEEEIPDLWTPTVQFPPLRPRSFVPVADDTPPGEVTGITITDTLRVNAEGTVVSVLRIAWDPKPWSTSVYVTGPLGFEFQAVSLGASQSLRIPAPGDYSIRLAHLSNINIEGDSTTSTHTVSWGDLKPFPLRVTEVRFAGSEVLILGDTEDEEPDIRGAEILYRREELESDVDVPVITEAQWNAYYTDNPPAGVRRAGGLTVLPSRGEQSLFIRFTVPYSGRYRFFIRLVNQFGLQSNMVDAGEHAISTALSPTGTLESQPLWLGEVDQTDVLPQLRREYLVYDPALAADDEALETEADDNLSFSQINGDLGWPFGPAPAPVTRDESRLQSSTYLVDLRDTNQVFNPDRWHNTNILITRDKAEMLLVNDGSLDNAGYRLIPFEVFQQNDPDNAGRLVDDQRAYHVQFQSTGGVSSADNGRWSSVAISRDATNTLLVGLGRRPFSTDITYEIDKFRLRQWSPDATVTRLLGRHAAILTESIGYNVFPLLVPDVATWPFLILSRVPQTDNLVPGYGPSMLLETTTIRGNVKASTDDLTYRTVLEAATETGTNRLMVGSEVLQTDFGAIIEVRGFKPEGITTKTHLGFTGTWTPPSSDIDAIIVRSRDTGTNGQSWVIVLMEDIPTDGSTLTINTIELLGTGDNRRASGDSFTISRRASDNRLSFNGGYVGLYGFKLGDRTIASSGAGYRQQIVDTGRQANFEARMREGFHSPPATRLPPAPAGTVDTDTDLQFEASDVPAALATPEGRDNVTPGQWGRYVAVRYMQGGIIMEEGFNNAAISILATDRRQVL